MSELLWIVQLALDLILAAGLGYLLWRLAGRRGRDLRHLSPQDLESFVSEASRLGRDFDRLLADKRELVSATLGTLDARIARLRELAAQLEQAPTPAPAPPDPAPAPAVPAQGFRAQVLELSGQGQTPPQIALALGRPLGEVELVLQLRKS